MRISVRNVLTFTISLMMVWSHVVEPASAKTDVDRPVPASHDEAARVPNLDASKPELRAAFNSTPENVRMILILSPT